MAVAPSPENTIALPLPKMAKSNLLQELKGVRFWIKLPEVLRLLAVAAGVAD